MNISRAFETKTDRICRGCGVELKAGTTVYSLPDGIFCKECTDKIETELDKKLNKPLDLSDYDIERMNEAEESHHSVHTEKAPWEFFGD